MRELLSNNSLFSVSCTTITHSCCALVIWSSLQLTSKQWIITQQFTAGAIYFLNNKFTLVNLFSRNAQSPRTCVGWVLEFVFHNSPGTHFIHGCLFRYSYGRTYKSQFSSKNRRKETGFFYLNNRLNVPPNIKCILTLLYAFSPF